MLASRAPAAASRKPPAVITANHPSLQLWRRKEFQRISAHAQQVGFAANLAVLKQREFDAGKLLLFYDPVIAPGIWFGVLEVVDEAEGLRLGETIPRCALVSTGSSLIPGR